RSTTCAIGLAWSSVPKKPQSKPPTCKESDDCPPADASPSSYPVQGTWGLAAVVKTLAEEIQELYLADEVPWVIGYSGGKDSTAVLQLVWLALQNLPEERRAKPVHVISTDTLVENPIVASWVTQSLTVMEKAAAEQGLPMIPHRLTPDVKDTFWVGLI